MTVTAACAKPSPNREHPVIACTAPLSRRKDRILSGPFNRSHRPTIRSLDLLHRQTPLGAWLLIAPIVKIITIPWAFQPRCAPEVSRRLRYLTPSGGFQNSLIGLAALRDLGRSSPGSPADDKHRSNAPPALPIYLLGG